MRTHVDLFSGIGGFALAARWAAVETVAFAEIDPYAGRVLQKHWPNVPNYGDVRNVIASPVSAVRGGFAIDSTWLVTGGVPCQPASIAGQRRGADDDRWLWPEAIAAVEKLRPTWVCLENPLGILSLEKPIMSLDLEGYGNLIEAALSSEGDFWANVTGEVGIVFRDLISSVEKLGYEVSPVVVPACGLGAWHRRYRVWIMGHATGVQPRAEQQSTGTNNSRLSGERDVSDSESNRRGQRRTRRSGSSGKRERKPVGTFQDVGVSEGVPKRPGLRAGHAARNGHGRSSDSGSAHDASDANGGRAYPESECFTEREGAPNPDRNGAIRTISHSDNAAQKGQREYGRQILCESESGRSDFSYSGDWWTVEPDVGRVAHGVPARLDRLRTLGNAIVPQVAYQLIKRMIEAEAFNDKARLSGDNNA